MPAAGGPPEAAPGIAWPPMVAALGGLLFMISSWLHWLGGFELTVVTSTGVSSYEVPAWFLFDVNAERGGLDLGVVVVVIGVVVLVGAVVHGLGLASLVGGVLGLALVALFSFQLNRLVDETNENIEEIGGPPDALSLTDLLDLGEYAAAAGAILAIVGGILSLRRS